MYSCPARLRSGRDAVRTHRSRLQYSDSIMCLDTCAGEDGRDTASEVAAETHVGCSDGRGKDDHADDEEW